MASTSRPVAEIFDLPGDLRWASAVPTAASRPATISGIPHLGELQRPMSRAWSPNVFKKNPFNRRQTPLADFPNVDGVGRADPTRLAAG